VAEDSDLEKTEAATGQRLEKARERGDIPRSRELNTCALLFSAGISLWLMGRDFNHALEVTLTTSLKFDRELAYNAPLLLNHMTEQVINLLIVFSPFVFILTLVALASPILVGGWVFSMESITPSFEKLNPMTGIARMFSKTSLIELVKAILKAALVGIAGYFVIASDFSTLMHTTTVPLPIGIETLESLLIRGFLLTTGVLVVIAAIDVPLQLYQYAEKLKMTKQEIRDENKESNGNPEIKSRIRQQQIEMARRRMMTQIPFADVVITNPTHYAVALQYSADSMGAPKLLAKGTDAVALRIREIAGDHKVMTLESPKLARAIYANTEIDDEIPSALYLAVAEILAYVFEVKNFSSQSKSYPNQPTDLDIPDELDPHFVKPELSIAI